MFIILNNNGIYAGLKELPASGIFLAISLSLQNSSACLMRVTGPIPPTALLPNARYEKIAEAFGGKVHVAHIPSTPLSNPLQGYFVTTVEELHAAMRAALAEHIPSLINVMIRTDGPVPKIVQQQKH